MAKRERMMLCHKFVPGKTHIGGWFLSEKLDGQRCFWDGGISRHFYKDEVPFANIWRDRQKTRQRATGLWTRYGNVIAAPDWWIDQLPRIPLDGELYWMGDPKPRQFLRSIISRIDPSDEDWTNVTYKVFDIVPIAHYAEPGRIKNANDETDIPIDCQTWMHDHATGVRWIRSGMQFVSSVRLQQTLDGWNEFVRPVHQERLPFPNDEAIEVVETRLQEIIAHGGEGVVLRKPESQWEARRSHQMLKYKPFEDMEGTVVGYVSGRETDKGSKLLGMIGAVILDIGDKTLELSGFTNDERAFSTHSAIEWAAAHPGQIVPDHFDGAIIKRGDEITFKYRGLSADGIPQEARYWR